ncbi:MAG: alpha-mannosidase [Cyanothece sp. SIO1E1]|nr:alpha-mannosidase [Cyanothece sp. SIO1E1]
MISEAIANLRNLTQVDVQSYWRFCLGDRVIATVADDWPTWPIATLNDRHHIAWLAGQHVFWLCQQITVPQALNHYPLAGLTLRLALTWWAEVAEIFVDGQPVQTGDLFDHSARIVLSQTAAVGQVFVVALRLVSPGHDQGALVRSRCMYEVPVGEADALCPEPGFVADELTVLQQYLTQLAPEKLDDLAGAIAPLDWSTLSERSTFDQFLAELRQRLQPLGDWLKHRHVGFVGHAHLDMAWLWPVSETWAVAERTFKSVLQLQQDFPALIFCHSTPALYAWIEANRPALFAAIQQQVAAGRWEIAAGLWVEPELNLVNGESIVRQVLYGQRYVQEKFGHLSAIAWLPDSFGFCWQLPQILKQGGIEYFVTQKLRWNDTTEFPHQVFWWRSPDGTQIFSLTAPPIGEAIDPIKISTYGADWEHQTGTQAALWLPGVGDHGGGPTRDMLETAQRWQQSPLFPQLNSTTALDFLRQLETTLTSPQCQNPDSKLSVWNDELYLEFHRGCYTSHADQKLQNRRCEDLLYQAELLAALATLTAATPYPKAELESAWKQMLFNQFHDILPGSSIPQVFVDANHDWSNVQQVSTRILRQSLGAIATQIALPPSPHPDAQPILVFNCLNWMRSELVTVALPANAPSVCHWQVCDSTGQSLQTQQPTVSSDSLLFLATDIPAVGYKIFWLSPSPSSLLPNLSLAENWVLENSSLRVTINPGTGDLSSVFDKINHREVLSGPGNRLQAFHDRGQYWDAWNIDPNYAEHPRPSVKLKAIRWLEQGPLRSRLQVVRQIGQSEFHQDYILETHASILKIVTTVDWQERQVLVKTAFPFTINADQATYEIPCGAIQRPTQPQTPHEKAKWEVPALHWADLSQANYGVSLLNDCKYGYDSQPGQLRLTLLRSPNWPDPDADRGQHQFTYALYPHAGSWQTAKTVQQGYELNLPLQVWPYSPLATAQNKNQQPLKPTGSLIDLGAKNLILTALKQSEDAPDQFILRCYECQGERANLTLQSDLNLRVIDPVNLLEQAMPKSNSEIPEPGSKPPSAQISPWQIASFRFAVPCQTRFMHNSAECIE